MTAAQWLSVQEDETLACTLFPLMTGGCQAALGKLVAASVGSRVSNRSRQAWPPAKEGLLFSPRDFVKAFIQFKKPIVVAINGPALGLGASILPLCDIVWASEKAWFQTPYATIRLTPAGCSSYTFPQILGVALVSLLGPWAGSLSGVPTRPLLCPGFRIWPFI